MFRYLRDPLFFCCFILYVANRLILKPAFEVAFLHRYLNDLICVPFLVPIMLFVLRRLQLRDHDRPPQIHEVVIPVLVWSIFFEILLPQHLYWSQWITGDPYDIFCYVIGGGIAYVYWNRAIFR